jgi:exosortase
VSDRVDSNPNWRFAHYTFSKLRLNRIFLSALFLMLAPLFLWAHLVNHLRVEWSLNPQYSYGWSVSALCAYLLWRNFSRSAAHKSSQPQSRREQGEVPQISLSPDASPITHQSLLKPRLSSSIVYLLLALCALLYAPTRLIEEANPDWRLVSWALALETIGITLCLLRLVFPLCLDTEKNSSNHDSRIEFPKRRPNVPPCVSREVSTQEDGVCRRVPKPGVETRRRDGGGPREVHGKDRGEVSNAGCFQVFALRSPFSIFLFPLCFFLVSVPWPTLIEGSLIQSLTRAVSCMTVEMLGALGMPAMRHGNVIELSNGLLGIDEACSGIRSFQATLMIALFLGELYRLTIRRRVIFCLTGFALAFTFNVARTLILSMVAARKGISSVASWHDPAGVIILVACFASLWMIGILLARRNKASSDLTAPTECSTESPVAALRSYRGSISLAFALCVWILVTEFAVEAWYRSHERNLPAATAWSVNWPTNNPSFVEIPFPQRTRQILRYDEGRNAAWNEDGNQWQVTFLRWNPGRTTLYLAGNHTPEVCMPAAGRKMISASELLWFDVNGLRMPFREYVFEDREHPLYVFYCFWNDHARNQGFTTMGLGYANRLAPVFSGLRNPGQRSIEIAVGGMASEEEAKEKLQRQLTGLVSVGAKSVD